MLHLIQFSPKKNFPFRLPLLFWILEKFDSLVLIVSSSSLLTVEIFFVGGWKMPSLSEVPFLNQVQGV